MKFIIKRNGVVEELSCPVYEIENVCKKMVEVAITDPKYASLFKDKYFDQMHFFSPYLAFCLNELDFELYLHDPLLINRNEVMFANRDRFYLASTDYINQLGFNKKSIINFSKGFPLPTDDVICYDPQVLPERVQNGIVDENGFVCSDFIPNFVQFAQIYLASRLIKDKSLYERYINEVSNYKDILNYLIHGLKITIIKVNGNNKTVLYDSNAEGKAMEVVLDLENTLKSNEVSGRKAA